MDKLLAYINGLSVQAQKSFAVSCGTSIGYLRKAISSKQKIGESLCINIERESGGEIRCEDLRSDVDWGFIRSTSKEKAA